MKLIVHFFILYTVKEPLVGFQTIRQLDDVSGLLFLGKKSLYCIRNKF